MQNCAVIYWTWIVAIENATTTSDSVWDNQWMRWWMFTLCECCLVWCLSLVVWVSAFTLRQYDSQSTQSSSSCRMRDSTRWSAMSGSPDINSLKWTLHWDIYLAVEIISNLIVYDVNYFFTCIAVDLHYVDMYASDVICFPQSSQ